MLAEILTIGDELCRGEIVDTNAARLAAALWDLDITVAWMTSCRDVAEDIRAALGAATARAEVVVASGGLGPTLDDLTVDVVSGLAGVEPEEHPPSAERLQKRFAAAGYRFSADSLRQVRAPGGARVHVNPAGLAPGFEVQLAGVPCFFLPGVPRELDALMADAVIPRLRELRDGGVPAERIARRIYRVFGRGEGQIAGELRGLCDGIAGASLHYQVSFPETLVKVVVRDRDEAAARGRLAEIDADIRARLRHLIYGVDGDSMAAAVGRALASASATLATAESCTGGQVGQLVTSVAGSSAYYLGGAITYSNAEKVRQLGVDPATLETHGAVSRECVVEMARGARQRFGSTLAVSVSGIAGPDGGTPDKPVGTVWIAVAAPDPTGFDDVTTKQLTYPGSRDQIRTLASYWALSLVMRVLSHG